MTDHSAIDNLTFGDIKAIAEEMGKLASLFHTSNANTKAKNNPTFNNSNTINLAFRDGELSHVESTTPIIQAGKVGDVKVSKATTKAKKKTPKQTLDEHAWYSDPEYVLGRIGIYHGNYATGAQYCDKEVVMINLTGCGKMACYVVDTKRIAMLDPEFLTDTDEKIKVLIAPDATNPAPQPTEKEEDISGADDEPVQLELDFNVAANTLADDKASTSQRSKRKPTQTSKKAASKVAKKTSKKAVKKTKATQAPTPKDMPTKKPNPASIAATPNIDFDSADESLTGINERILKRKLKRMEERGEI